MTFLLSPHRAHQRYRAETLHPQEDPLTAAILRTAAEEMFCSKSEAVHISP
jgi:hypothetical protein